MDEYRLDVQPANITLTPGCIVMLGRFNGDKWKVNHGWYSFGGNRPVCGWYLEKIDAAGFIKPLQLPDLDDIYLIENV